MTNKNVYFYLNNMQSIIQGELTVSVGSGT